MSRVKNEFVILIKQHTSWRRFSFSVSLANGLNDTKMRLGRKTLIAGTFAFFQCAMPLIGWFLVTRIEKKFEAFQKYVPWIALFLLLIIGIDMILEGLKENRENFDTGKVTDNIKVSEAKKLGCYELTLNVWEGNDGALAFYKAMGMKPKETQMEYILS